MSIHAISRHPGLRRETVKNIDKAYLEETLPALDPTQLTGLKYRSVDEVARAKNHDYITVIYGLVEGHLVGVGVPCNENFSNVSADNIFDSMTCSRLTSPEVLVRLSIANGNGILYAILSPFCNWPCDDNASLVSPITSPFAQAVSNYPRCFYQNPEMQSPTLKLLHYRLCIFHGCELLQKLHA